MHRTFGVPFDSGEDGERHALKRRVDSGSQRTDLIAVPLLQLKQETVFWSRVDTAIFMVASAHKHALWVEAAAKHHERQRFAAVTPVIHKVAKKNHVAVLTRQT